ncbi:MAG TPA: HNH endonuclease signature motif containing protein [Streptosporangiaceae bacterium]|nr:HNH endonuclease signature motif containing protein [Streptosporangiaceae bacterium]
MNLTMPLATWLGLSDVPGHAAGYGPLDASDSRDLAARLAGQLGSRWCITLTGEDGRPVAHGCARTGPAPSGRSRPPPRRPPRGGGSPGRSPRNGGSPRRTATPPDWLTDVTGWRADVTGWLTDVTEWLAGIAVSRLETGDCRHLRESPSYRPPPRLRHLVTIRQPTCSFPGCRWPSIRCDEDHTLPYDQGGRTCECNLAPACR